MAGLLVSAEFLDGLAEKLAALAEVIDPAAVSLVDYTVTGSASVESSAETAQKSERARATQIAANLRALATNATTARETMDATDAALAGQG